jgi:polygalacturonase
MRSLWIALLPFCVAVLSARPAAAQDMRHVSQPVVPPSCLVLTAELAATGNRLPDSAENTLDTARLQSAIDKCGAGKAVELKADGAHNAFLSGPIHLEEGVVLLIDKGVTLYASRNPRLYDKKPGVCGTIDSDGHNCNPLISVTDVKNAGVMGDGIIDGQGDAQILGQKQSWWQLADEAHRPPRRLQNCPRLIIANNADGFVLYRITLHNSPNFHVVVQNTNGFTAWGVHVQSPTVPGTSAFNTDGIDPGNSTNITVTKSWLDTGDDNIAIKTGVTHMSVLDNHFYAGHGMSIGSETFSGDSDILVDRLTMDGTTNGVRVKSNVKKGGLVHDLTYRNICMRNVQVAIALTPFYHDTPFETFADPGFTGDRIPDYKRIRIENVVASTPGEVLIAGKDAAHVTEVSLIGVQISGIKPDQVHAQFAEIELSGTNVPAPNGIGVQVKTVKEAAPAPLTCSFPPMR